MLARLDRFVIWLVVAIVVSSILFGVAIEQLVSARRALLALNALEHADPLDRKPPATLVKVIHDEIGSRNSPSGGPLRVLACMQWPAQTQGWRLHLMPDGWWIGFRFSEEDLVGLYVSQGYLGNDAPGFAAGARYYYGRELNELNANLQRCLARKVRGPASPRFTCNGQQSRAALDFIASGAHR